MKFRLRFWLWILIIFCIFSTTLEASTQGRAYPVITPANADQLVEVAQMGSGKIRTMFWTPDNQQLIVVDDAGFYFYDAANLDAPPRFIEDMTGRLKRHYDFAVSPDTRYIAGIYGFPPFSGGDPIKSPFDVWEVSTGQHLATVSLPDTNKPDGHAINQAVFSPDSRTLVIQTFNGALFRWEVGSGDKAHVIKPSLSGDRTWPDETQIAFSPDGAWLVECTDNIHLWETERWTNTASWDIANLGLPLNPNCLTFNSAGTRLIIKLSFGAELEDTHISLWSLPDGQQLATQTFRGRVFPTFDEKGVAVILTEEPQENVSPSQLKLVEIETGVIRWQTEENVNLTRGYVTPNARHILYFHYRGDGVEAVAVETLTGREILRVFFSVATLTIRPDSQQVAIAGGPTPDASGWRYDDTLLRIWDLNTGELVATPEEHWQDIDAIGFSPDDQFVAVGRSEADIVLWDTTTWALEHLPDPSYAALPRFHAEDLQFSPDGKSLSALVESTNSSQLRVIWHMANRELDESFFNLYFPNSVINSAWSAIAYESDHALHVLDLPDQTERFSQYLYQNSNEIAFSPDGTLVGVAMGEQKVMVWDAATGKVVAEITPEMNFYQQGLEKMFFSPDNRLLVLRRYSYIYDEPSNYVEIWNLETQERWLPLAQPIYNVTFHPHESAVAIIFSEGRTLQFFDTNTGQPLANRFGGTGIEYVTFSPAGDLLALQSDFDDIRNRQVSLWEWGSGTQIIQLTGHADLYAPQFSTAGTLFAVRSTGQRLLIYGVPQ